MPLDNMLESIDVEDLQGSLENLDYNEPLYSILKCNMKAKAKTEVVFPTCNSIAS